MTKKLFSLFTLLLVLCASAWAVDSRTTITWDFTTDDFISGTWSTSAGKTNTIMATDGSTTMTFVVSGSNDKYDSNGYLKTNGKTSYSSNILSQRYFTFPKFSGRGVIKVKYASSNANTLNLRNATSNKTDPVSSFGSTTASATVYSDTITFSSSSTYYLSFDVAKVYFEEISWIPFEVVTFDATTNGGSCTTETIDVVKGGTISSLPVATKDGYTFDGWYTSATGDGTPLTTSTSINEDITYYARFSVDLTPSMNIDPASAETFTYVTGNGPSDAQSFTISLANSENPVSASISGQYEMCKTENGTYTSEGFTDLTNESVVYVRLKSGLGVNSYAGTLTFSNEDIDDPVEIELSGSVTNPFYTVTYYNGSVVVGSESVESGDHPADYGDYEDLGVHYGTFGGWYNNSDLAAEHAIADISALTITENTSIFGKYAPKYSTSINIEQLILDNGKSYGITTAFTTANILYNDLDALDSLLVNKSLHNEPYLGLKYKKETSYIEVFLKKGSTLRVKFGYVGANLDIKVGDEDAESKSSATLASPYEYTATSDVAVRFSSTSTKTVVFKQIMIDAPIAEVRPFAITILGGIENGSVVANLPKAKAGEMVTLTPSPADGYRLYSYNIQYDNWEDKDHTAVPTTIEADGNTFTMPSYPVTVSATFIPSSVSKNITNAGWATYCSPYPLDFSSSITNLTQAYLVTDGNAGVLELSKVSGTVPAQTGLLLKGKGDCVIPTAASGSTVSGNKLIGVIEETEIDAGAGYVLLIGDYGLGFYKNANAFTVGANTAYLPVGFAGASEAPSVIRIVDEENNATDIEAIDATEEAVKFIEDGKLYIKKNNVVYDALGRVIR